MNCSAKVNAGRSMVRGLQNKRRCEGKVVFTHEGHGYCAAHARGLPGYVPAAKGARHTYIVHYEAPDGSKSWSFIYDAKSERGARQAFSRVSIHAGYTITRLVERPEGPAHATDDGEWVRG